MFHKIVINVFSDSTHLANKTLRRLSANHLEVAITVVNSFKLTIFRYNLNTELIQSRLEVTDKTHTRTILLDRRRCRH